MLETLTAPSLIRRLLPVLSVALVSSAATAFVVVKHYQARLAEAELDSTTTITTLREKLLQTKLDGETSLRKGIEHARAAEQVKIRTLEKERATQLETVRIMGLALADSRRESERMRTTIATERQHAAELATAAGRDPGAAQAPWLVLDECRQEYGAVAEDADALTERARLGTGYARSVNAE